MLYQKAKNKNQINARLTDEQYLYLKSVAETIDDGDRSKALRKVIDEHKGRLWQTQRLQNIRMWCRLTFNCHGRECANCQNVDCCLSEHAFDGFDINGGEL